MKCKKSLFKIIIEDIQFFSAYFKAKGFDIGLGKYVINNYSNREILNFILFNIGALTLNIELTFVTAYLFYTMPGVFYTFLNTALSGMLFLTLINSVSNLILLFNMYRNKAIEENMEVDEF